ncbi:MAG: hypothetical protein AB1330_10770 [Bacillota bacterium]
MVNTKVRLTAERLLRDFPRWWAWCKRLGEETAEAVAWEGYSGELQAVFRKAGLPGDPTGRRALRLLETNELKRAIEVTRRFVSGLTDERQQRTLIGVWRMHSFGWAWVAKSAGLDVAEAVITWTAMVAKFEEVLKSAGVGLLELRASELGGAVRTPARTDEGREGNNDNRGRRKAEASGGV